MNCIQRTLTHFNIKRWTAWVVLISLWPQMVGAIGTPPLVRRDLSDRRSPPPLVATFVPLSAHTDDPSDADIDPEYAREIAQIRHVETTWRSRASFAHWTHMPNRCAYWVLLKNPHPHGGSSSIPLHDLSGDLSEPLLPLGEESPPSSHRGSFHAFQQVTHRLTSLFPQVGGRLWISGFSFSFEDDQILKHIHGVNAFVAGTGEVLEEGLHLFLLTLLGSQIVYSIKEGSPFTNFLKIFFVSGDDNSLRDFYSLTAPVPYARFMWFVLLIPVIWGTYEGIQGYRQGVDRTHNDHALHVLDHSPPGLFKDYLRWAFPFNRTEHALHILGRALVWDHNVSLDDKGTFLEHIEQFCSKHRGWGRMNGLHVLYQVVGGVSLKDMKHLEEDEEKALLALKGRAFRYLKEMGMSPTPKLLSFRILSEGIPSLYSRYLLWRLGHYNGPIETTAWGVFQGGKIALSVLLLKTLIEGIRDILNCPQQPGKTWTGETSWSSDFTYECWQAYMRAFNQVPGQPAETLTALFPQFHLPSEVVFDLSGKGINGTVMAQLLRGFRLAQPDVAIVAFDGSNNVMGQVSSDDVVDFAQEMQYLNQIRKLDLSRNSYIGSSDSLGTIAIANALEGTPELEILDLSSNQIGSNDSNGTVALGNGLKDVPQLQHLRLSSNQIGSIDSNGTVALGNGLKDVPQLQHLDLSGNSIGERDSQGTVALGNGLKDVPQLQHLDLSSNQIGSIDSNGAVALGNGLKHTMQLEILDLSNNQIENTDSNGTIAIGNALKYLSKLEILGLLGNGIGYINSQGIVAIGDGLKHTTQLEILDLSSNSIENTDSNGTVSLGNGLRYLSRLQLLDVSNNDIGTHNPDGVNALASGISFTPLLTTFNIDNNQLNNLNQTVLFNLEGAIKSLHYLSTLMIRTQTTGVIPTWMKESLANYMEGQRSLGPINTDLLNFLYPQELVEYLHTLPNTTQTLDLGSRFTETLPLMQALAGELPRFSTLKTLILSGNDIGKQSSLGLSELVTKAFPFLPSLENLDLSNNYIEDTDSNGTIALGEGLKNTPQLKSLNLGTNVIGDNDSRGIVALGKNLKYTPRLQILNLSSGGLFGEWDDGIQALMEGLKYVSALEVLDLSDCFLGAGGSSGTVFLGEGLEFIPQLLFLNLSYNDIGLWDSNGSIALGKALPSLRSLITLDLSNNVIGLNGPQGPQAILSALPSLFGASLQNVNISGMLNVPANEGLTALSILLDRQLRASCESQRCHGGSVSQPSFHPQSEASRIRRMVSNASPFSLTNSSSSSQSSWDSFESQSRQRPSRDFSVPFEFEPITSSASRPQIPGVFKVVPDLIGLFGEAWHYLTTPSVPSFEPMLYLDLTQPHYRPLFTSHAGALPSQPRVHVNACANIVDPFEGTGVLLKRPAPSLQLDEILIGLTLISHGMRSTYTHFTSWLYPAVEPEVIPASSQYAKTSLRRASHSLHKSIKAFEALKKFHPDPSSLWGYEEALSMREETLLNLTEKRKRASSLGVLSCEELDTLELDLKTLLDDLEEDLSLVHAELKNGKWIINSLPEAERQKEMTHLSERLTQVKRDMKTMYDLLGTGDSLDPYVPLFEEIKSSLDAFETERSLPQKALKQLDEQLETLEELLQKERVFQFIEDTNGTLTLDQLLPERAQQRINSLREQFVKCNDAFDFMQTHCILPQKTLDEVDTHVESLLGGLNRFITLLEKGSRESETSFVPTKGLDKLQEGLTALEKWMLQYMEFTDNAWDGKLLSSEEGHRGVTQSHELLTNCQRAMHSLRNSEKLCPEALFQTESAIQGFKDTHKHLISLLEAREETDEDGVKHFLIPQKLLDAHVQAMQVFLNSARQVLGL